MGEDPLIAAVRSGDARAVSALLDAGAAPDTADEHGIPALCLAVDAFDLPTVEALLETSVRLDRVAPDGRTALLRAVDLGARDITEALVNSGAQLWSKDAERRDALALARYWHETGAVAELRRRSGRSGPVGRRTVESDFGVTCTELSLAGLTVRDGHTAILTVLEPRYGIRTSFDELSSRALAEPDVDHEVWWATTDVLWKRRDPAVWEAAAALRDRSDPLERCFGAQVLRLANLFDESDDRPFEEALIDLFVPWAEREPDPRVVEVLAAGLADCLDPRVEGSLLALARHREDKVRLRAVSGLDSAVKAGSLTAQAAVMERTRDEQAAVRRAACTVLSYAPMDSSAPSNALAACLADENEDVRVEAAAQLALRNDHRGDEVLRSFDFFDEDSPYYWLLDAVQRHRQNTP